MYIELHRMPSGGPRMVVELVSTCTVIQFQKKMVLFFTKKIEKMSSIKNKPWIFRLWYHHTSHYISHECCTATSLVQ
jgi:hypothetical protein